MVLSASFGSYPRPNFLREYQIASYGKQKKIDHKYSQKDLDVMKKAVEEVVSDQKGLNIITDGMLTWDDYLAHIASGFNGMEMGGLIRFYDNNTYYRRPAITNDISGKKLLAGEMHKYVKTQDSKLKTVIPGPYTLYKLSEDKYYKDPAEAISAITNALEAEIKALETDYIQIDEPSLSYGPDKDLTTQAIEAVNALCSKVEGKSIVATYFGDSSRVMDDLAEIKADYLGIDCVSFPQNYDALLQSGIKNVQLGLLDARNTKIEEEAEVRKKMDAVDSDDIIISTNCGLEFLPRQYAKRKLDLLSRL